ncbi:MAG TPA: ABC transporter permease [Puia sp.]|nr:ABC transporter permease [Puia sp.]
MFKNYFKTALRNLLKNKFYSVLNIAGLAFGLATCLLILLYVLDELSFDQYNADASRIYRINNELKYGDNHIDLAVAAAPMGPEVLKEFPQVKQYTRICSYGSFRVKKRNENLREDRVAYADSTLFQVFTLPVLAGDSRTALTEPRSLVITQAMAKKYFPREAAHNLIDVIGKNLLINDTTNYKITGVIKDIPVQSHFNFDFFLSMTEDNDSRTDDWLSSQDYNTYIVLDKKADPGRLEAELDKMMDRYTAPQLQSALNISIDKFKKSGGFIRASLIPLSNIHLYSNKIGELGANSDAQFVYIFSAIALFILLIACVNFMNLSTARSSGRAKEVGIRKVLGSIRKNLIAQFLAESFLISFISLVLSVLIACLLLPYFNVLAGKSIAPDTLFKPSMLLSLVVLMLVVGLLAGSYPAFFLSSFQPISVLKGKLAAGFKRSWLRDALVVFQFVISIILIIGTVVIFNQLNYIRTKNIGFDRHQVLVLQHTNILKDKAEAFKRDLLQMSGIENVTMTGFLPTNSDRSTSTCFTSPALDLKTALHCQVWSVDENYVPTLNIQFTEGRNFSTSLQSDSMGIIINEAAAKFLATKEVLNKKLYMIVNNELPYKSAEYHVIGIIKNFNFSSLRNVIAPLILRLQQNNDNISARITTSNIPSVLAQIKNSWAALAPGEPLNYSFMDEQFDNLYVTEQKTGQIFITFAVIAIVIACLGLFGLITYAAEQRAKEIGIRKVLGANLETILVLISKDFLRLIIISMVVASPIAYWIMTKWLQDFAYRISISWWMIAVAGLAATVISLITISFQSIKAAIANPVKSLRTDG